MYVLVYIDAFLLINLRFACFLCRLQLNELRSKNVSIGILKTLSVVMGNVIISILNVVHSEDFVCRDTESNGKNTR